MNLEGYKEVSLIRGERVEPYEWEYNFDKGDEMFWKMLVVKFAVSGLVLKEGDVGRWKDGTVVLSWRAEGGVGKGGKTGVEEIAWDILEKFGRGRKSCAGGERFWKEVGECARENSLVGERARRVLERFGHGCR